MKLSGPKLTHYIIGYLFLPKDKLFLPMTEIAKCRHSALGLVTWQG